MDKFRMKGCSDSWLMGLSFGGRVPLSRDSSSAGGIAVFAANLASSSAEYLSGCCAMWLLPM